MKAIIVGATSGIGKEIAINLINKGWSVGISGRRLSLLENIQSEHDKKRVFISEMDVTRPDATNGLDALISTMGAPDLLLYVSGIGYENHKLDPDKEIRTLQTNCEGMARIVVHFFNYVRNSPNIYTPNKKAHVAVVTSIAGTAGLGTAPAYSASKRMQSTYISALSQLSRMESVPIDFSDIRPGFVKTAILDSNKHYPMTMSVEQAAKHIIKGLEQKKRVITFDWKYKILVFFWRLIPRPIWERLTIIKTTEKSC